MAKIYQTPGVYIEEKNAFPNSVVAVGTAIPAFIGHTEKAIFAEKNLTHQPTRISSFSEYLLYFGEAPTTTYSISKPDEEKGFRLNINEKNYLLFNAIRLFYANGGSDCYIVSVGNYEKTIEKDNYVKAINTLLKYPEPTMLVIPEAVLLEEKECYELQQKMLEHCGGEMKNRIAILDIYNGNQARTGLEDDVITKFQTGIGRQYLSFGAAYYPWLETTITHKNEISFKNISTDTLETLITILKEEADALPKKSSIKDKIDELKAPKDDNLHQVLLTHSPLYKNIIQAITKKVNILPPAAAMAGIYSMVDNSKGVFQAPANVSIGSVIKPTVNISNNEQEDLNMPLNGKAVNAIRSFPGKGVLVWGARTLDGNSQDWRYISVRRTVIMIEQSIKLAAEAYVFEPNTALTWTTLKGMVDNYLTNVWKSGGLTGATPEDAFSVDIGLGSTMTAVDILDGIMRISVKIAVTRPAEFIILSFEQQMQKP